MSTSPATSIGIKLLPLLSLPLTWSLEKTRRLRDCFSSRLISNSGVGIRWLMMDLPAGAKLASSPEVAGEAQHRASQMRERDGRISFQSTSQIISEDWNAHGMLSLMRLKQMAKGFRAAWSPYKRHKNLKSRRISRAANRRSPEATCQRPKDHPDCREGSRQATLPPAPSKIPVAHDRATMCAASRPHLRAVDRHKSAKSRFRYRWAAGR